MAGRQKNKRALSTGQYQKQLSGAQYTESVHKESKQTKTFQNYEKYLTSMQKNGNL